MEEMIKKYHELYEDMKHSGDPMKMNIFGEADKWAFKTMSELSPKHAEIWLGILESIRWNNYLTDTEASHIASTLANQDGTQGAVWDKATFLSVIEKGGGEAERMPYYNSNALWVTAAMIYSDHAKSIAEDMGYSSVAEVPVEKLAMSTYRKAVEKLCDKDRKFFVRPYYAEYLMG